VLDSVGHIKEKLQILLQRENFSNAFIVSAPKGSGKSKTILEIVEKVLVSSDIRCSNLLWVKSEKEKILIAQIRGIYNFLGKTSYNKKPRIIVIDPADCLNAQSSNALLKILEDCNSNTYFILLTNNLNNLLRTVRSRCINFKLPVNQNKNSGLDDKMNQSLYITNGIAGSAKALIEESGLEFYQLILEVLDKFDKDVQILYKFLDKYFAKDMSENKWSVFTMVVEHILSKMSKFEFTNSSDIIPDESRVFKKLFTSLSEERKGMISMQIRELIYKCDTCSLSRYNVALLVFLKIRGI